MNDEEHIHALMQTANYLEAARFIQSHPRTCEELHHIHAGVSDKLDDFEFSVWTLAQMIAWLIKVSRTHHANMLIGSPLANHEMTHYKVNECFSSQYAFLLEQVCDGVMSEDMHFCLYPLRTQQTHLLDQVSPTTKSDSAAEVANDLSWERALTLGYHSSFLNNTTQPCFLRLCDLGLEDGFYLKLGSQRDDDVYSSNTAEALPQMVFETFLEDVFIPSLKAHFLTYFIKPNALFVSNYQFRHEL